MYSPKVFLINAIAILGVIALIVGIKYATDCLKSSGIIQGVEKDDNPFVPGREIPEIPEVPTDPPMPTDEETDYSYEENFPAIGSDPEKPLADNNDIDVYLL